MIHSIARLLNYSFVILCNNDIIIPNGAIEAITDVLQNNVSIVVPLSSEKGAGHNPSQVDFRHCSSTTVTIIVMQCTVFVVLSHCP